MNRLGITKCAGRPRPGAAIVARYALEHPDRVPRMMAVSPPLFRLAPSTPIIPPTPPVSPPPSRPVSPAAETLISSPLPRPGAASAETIPSRTPAMNARLEAARDAAAPPPSDGASKPAPPPVPAPSAITPPPPVPDPGDGSLPNPLRDHLDSLDPLALLEKHVEAGADLEAGSR